MRGKWLIDRHRMDLTPAVAALLVAFLKLWILNGGVNPFCQNNLEGDHLRHVPVSSQVVFDG